MPPRKAKISGDEGKQGQPRADSKQSSTDNTKRIADVKRKKSEANGDFPQKVPRRSARGVAKSSPSIEKLMNFFLSDSATLLCRSKDE